MASERIAMNNAVHQLIQLILQGLTSVLRTAESLWDWSWAQINAVFAMPWGHLPAWKIAVGIVVIAALAALLFAILSRSWYAFARIAAAFWAMCMMLICLLAFVVVAGLFSRGFQWIVASVPDRFWEGLI
jgi:hypothetical protein